MDYYWVLKRVMMDPMMKYQLETNGIILLLSFRYTPEMHLLLGGIHLHNRWPGMLTDPFLKTANPFFNAMPCIIELENK